MHRLFLIVFSETYLELEEKAPNSLLQYVMRTLLYLGWGGKDSSGGIATTSPHRAVSWSSGVEQKEIQVGKKPPNTPRLAAQEEVRKCQGMAPSQAHMAAKALNLCR